MNEKVIEVARNIISAGEQLEKVDDLTNKHFLPKIKKCAEAFISDPSRENGDALIGSIASANAYMEGQEFGTHILDYPVIINGNRASLSELSGDFEECLRDEYRNF